MKKITSDNSGLLIVHLWCEDGHPEGLRARITQMLSSSTAEQSIAVAASPDDIAAIVKRWVNEFVDPTRRDGAGLMRPVGES